MNKKYVMSMYKFIGDVLEPTNAIRHIAKIYTNYEEMAKDCGYYATTEEEFCAGIKVAIFDLDNKKITHLEQDEIDDIIIDYMSNK